MKVKLTQAQPPSPHTSLYAWGAIGLFTAYALVSLSQIDQTRVTDSQNRTDVTAVRDKISCSTAAFQVHLGCCWITFLAGAFAILFRFASFYVWFEFYNFWHMWLGRAYILGMLWTAATSTLIRNEGLPLGTLISFLWVLGGLTFGYVLINVDRSSPVSRMTHGALMVTSFVGIAGRIMYHDARKDFQCYTQPAYKSNLTLLPAHDPNYDAMPWAGKEVWGWGLPLFAGPFVGSLLVGYFYLE